MTKMQMREKCKKGDKRWKNTWNFRLMAIIALEKI